MNLGERIYRMRSEKNLSQGDLAEMLGVSRQSISKWENNSAVPDLDKIVKLSEIFGVSIDVLVKGERIKDGMIPVSSNGQACGGDNEEIQQFQLESGKEMMRQENNTHQTREHVTDGSANAFPPRMIAGSILFCMAFLVTVIFLAVGAGLVGLVLALPLIGCGTICFVCKQNIGLWCCWLLYLMFDIYMRMATGINHGALANVIRYRHIYGHTWIIHAAVSLVLLIMILALMIVTFCRFRKRPIEKNRKVLTGIVLPWAVFVAVQVIFLILPLTKVYSHVLIHILSVGSIFQLAYSIVEWCGNIAFVYALTNTVRYVRSRKLAKKGEMS